MFLSSRGGYIKYTVPLNITKYLAREDEYVPWQAVDNNLDFITTILPRSGSTAKYLEVCAGNFTLFGTLSAYRRPIFNKYN